MCRAVSGDGGRRRGLSLSRVGHPSSDLSFQKPPGRQGWGGGSESGGACSGSMGVGKARRCMEKGEPTDIGGLEVG